MGEPMYRGALGIELGQVVANLHASITRPQLNLQLTILTLSTERVREITDFLLNTLGLLANVVVRNSILLTCNLESKLKSRLRVLDELKMVNLLTKKYSLYTIIGMSEKDFLVKFVDHYSQLEKLHCVYKGMVEDASFMRQGEATIVYSFEEGKGTNAQVKNVLCAISQLDHLILAFKTIKSNPRNMTPSIQEKAMQNRIRDHVHVAAWLSVVYGSLSQGHMPSLNSAMILHATTT
eukprot:Gb_13533 [translate_table: standard]